LCQAAPAERPRKGRIAHLSFRTSSHAIYRSSGPATRTRRRHHRRREQYRSGSGLPPRRIAKPDEFAQNHPAVLDKARRRAQDLGWRRFEACAEAALPMQRKGWAFYRLEKVQRAQRPSSALPLLA
jgi:hypothetical protein